MLGSGEAKWLSATIAVADGAVGDEPLAERRIGRAEELPATATVNNLGDVAVRVLNRHSHGIVGAACQANRGVERRADDEGLSTRRQAP